MTKQEMETLVERQLEAYNRHDLDAFCACYHPEVEVSRSIGEAPNVKGMKDFRAVYEDRFQSAELHAEIGKRIVLENAVIDEERVVGLASAPNGLHVAAIYGFRDGLIQKVTFVR